MVKKTGLMLAGATAIFVAGIAVGSTMQNLAVAHAQSGKVYELRTYTAPEGKLGDLHARFRNHTMRIFDQHDTGTIGSDRPLSRCHVLGRDECRLAAHGELETCCLQSLINRLTKPLNASDLSGGIWQRCARLLLHAPDLVGKLHPGVRGLGCSGNRGRGGGLRGGRQGDMALGCEQRGGGIEPDPAGAGDIDLCPGVQVGEIFRRAARAIPTRLILSKLDEVARDESSRQPTVP